MKNIYVENSDLFENIELLKQDVIESDKKINEYVDTYNSIIDNMNITKNKKKNSIKVLKINKNKLKNNKYLLVKNNKYSKKIAHFKKKINKIAKSKSEKQINIVNMLPTDEEYLENLEYLIKDNDLFYTENIKLDLNNYNVIVSFIDEIEKFLKTENENINSNISSNQEQIIELKKKKIELLNLLKKQNKAKKQMSKNIKIENRNYNKKYNSIISNSNQLKYLFNTYIDEELNEIKSR